MPRVVTIAARKTAVKPVNWGGAGFTRVVAKDAVALGLIRKPCAHASEIGGGIDTRRRRVVRDQNRNSLAMPERAKLFERLGFFDWRLGKGGKRAQEFRPIRI